MFFLVIAISSISLEKGMNFFSNIINKTGSWVNFRIIILKKVCHKSQYIIRNKLKEQCVSGYAKIEPQQKPKG
ncbi:unnamed protein product [Rhizophagus irregularis]|uniref:Uncharacterized protein n=1 Tax=Rhizophagus irregularis TaxID=588596 RepID=A0A916DZH3_9GLOM|nr:unnamed protein product [Rhizophagus irregularis]CAB5151488.1 unnamed protein product [Rhizophagus irregularis]CAB5329527.1 unnamed protein product [Rhizophagus irregularis]